MCTFGYQYVYLHYNVGIQVVVEFPNYFNSWIPGYQYAVLFHNLGNLCAPLVTNMGVYITTLGSRLWLNSQFISILGFQATNMLFYFTILGYVCTFGYQYVYLHYNVGIQVVVEFPIYFHSWIPGYQYAVLFHNLGNLCAPLVTNMGIYITMLGSRLWLNSQFISILGFQATNMLFYFTILGYVCTFGYQCVSTLQCWDPGCS